MQAQQAHLERQLSELGSLRRELQGLYESAHDELSAARAEVASERAAREEALAANALLRQWNTQLGEELSVLVNELRSDDPEDAAALESPSSKPEAGEPPTSAASAASGAVRAPVVDASELSRANAEVVAKLLRLRNSGTERERKERAPRPHVSSRALSPCGASRRLARTFALRIRRRTLGSDIWRARQDRCPS